MSKSIQSQAEPAMIVWCRERAGRTVQEVADKLWLADSDIMFWEYGENTPTLPQLKSLAKFLKFPTAIFYLKQPPDWTPIRDFRRLPDAKKGIFSPELSYWTRLIQGRREWLAEYFESQGRDVLEFIGEAKTTENPVVVGQRLREILHVSLAEQKAVTDKAAAFRMWRGKCEAAGVSVFLTRKISIHEMRGFALSHPIAPLVAVNDQDRGGGRIFTLLHEMAHILLNISGISDGSYSDKGASPDQAIEAFCNAVAAEALVPSADFLRAVKQHEDNYTAAIPLLSSMYCVSDDVIAKRLLDHGLMTKGQYEQLLAQYRERHETPPKPNKKRKVRIKQARTVLATVGRNFGQAVVSAYHEDEITGSEVSDLLDMKAQFLPEFEKELYPG